MMVDLFSYSFFLTIQINHLIYQSTISSLSLSLKKHRFRLERMTLLKFHDLINSQREEGLRWLMRWDGWDEIFEVYFLVSSISTISPFHLQPSLIIHHLSLFKIDQIHHGQIMWYSRRNPHNSNDVSPHFEWVGLVIW